MTWTRVSRRMAGAIAAALGLWLVTICTFASVQANAQQTPDQPEATAPEENPLVIKTESPLPDTYPHGTYDVRLQAVGGVPALRWQLEKGTLPPGIRLESDGLLHGIAERPGEYQFTVSVRDRSEPEQAVEKQFVIRVRAALSLIWHSPAHVIGNRIEGSAEVSNTTPDDIDLTFIVLAVAANGRATAIGYQHFELARGTTAKELSFGDTLPRGGYVVHVDAVGEVAPKNLIYRERMQTPGPLEILTGP